MKKSLVCFFLAQFLVGLLSPAFAVAADLKDVRVGVYDNYPKIYRDEKGDIKGFWADITNYIAEKEDWKLTYVYDSWDKNLERLKNGEIDLMVDVAVTDERKQTYDFNNETALNSWGILYTRKGVTINSFQDLAGKNIAVLKSGVLYSGAFGLSEIFDSFNIHPASIIDVKEYGEVFNLLDTGAADVGAVNWFFGIANENKYRVDRTGIIFQPSELRYALTKNAPRNDYLISVLDFELKSLKSDSSSFYNKFIEDNFGAFLPKVEKEVLPQWVWIFLAVVFALAVIATGIFSFMRRYEKTLQERIEERTGEVLYKNAILEGQYETTIDGILLVDEKGEKIISSNKHFMEMWGIPQSILDTKDDKKMMDSILDQLKSPESFVSKVRYLYEHKSEKSFDEIDLKDGRVFERYSSPLVDANKVYRGRIWYFRDITKRKESDKKVAELNDLRNVFIKIVSHQLRTPLTAIKWNLELALDEKTRKLPGGLKEILQSIYDAASNIIKRIDDMIVTLDIEEGGVDFRKEVFSLDSLVKSVAISTEKKCAIKQIKFSLNIGGAESYAVNGDINKIRSAIEQLTDNAVTFTHEKGEISISMKQTDGTIRVEITDNGIGVPATEKDRLFSRFFRASNGFVMNPDASGLGLYIAKNFIEKHDGKIGFESEEGRGSTFWFELPRDTGSSVK